MFFHMEYNLVPYMPCFVFPIITVRPRLSGNTICFRPNRGNVLSDTAQRTALALPALPFGRICGDSRGKGLKRFLQCLARLAPGLYNGRMKMQAGYMSALEVHTGYNRGVHRSCHGLQLLLLHGSLFLMLLFWCAFTHPTPSK